MKNIIQIAKKIGLTKKDLFLYGNYMSKINYDYENSTNKDGKLILVTSINPTPYGEGKTTLSIGLNDSLNLLEKKSVAALREPSLGPVFGRKGGAIGGGKSIVIPSNEINLHFTGDFHAITSANNLLCAIVDNHIYQGNKLNIDKVVIKRCLDVNDRSLRGNFVITPASEIMAIFCLSKNIEDLKRRIGNIIVGYTKENKEVYAKDLNAVDAVTLLLKDAIKPNLVQSKYGNPILIHGGPFANIAHGCSSIIATKTALKLSDYVITEAGFGSDLGAIKFFDIKCKNNNIYPEAIILNVTIQALKHNGENNLSKGISNLEFHINNMKKYTSNLIVALNKFKEDKEEEIQFIKDFCTKLNIDFSICTNYLDGEIGCIELANKIINLKKNTKKYKVYNINDSLEEKINKMCRNELGANIIEYTDLAKEKLKLYKNKKLDICISKTPMSLTQNPKILGYPKDFKLKITDINLYNGASFITIMLGNVITMPGLTKDSNYINMKIDNYGNISGIN